MTNVPPLPIDRPVVNRVDLVVDRMSAGIKIAEEAIENLRGSPAELKGYLDHISRAVIVEISKMFAYEKTGEIVVDRYESWWDHFKMDVLPDWLRRWLGPVRKFRQTYEARAYYPSIPLRGHEPRVRFHVMDELPVLAP